MSEFVNSSFIFSLKQDTMVKAYFEINWLLDKGYPKKGTIEFVGNRYKLPKKARYVLNRATQTAEEVKKITRNKIVDPSQLEGLKFNIDFYNQFTSFQSLFDNEPLIICRDGIYRDIFSVLHSKKQLRIDINTVTRYIENLRELKPSYLLLFFDQQRSHSEYHSEIVEEVLRKNRIPGKCIVSRLVDHMLKEQNDGVIFSHDSIILGKSKVNFDYFSWYIEKSDSETHFTTQLINFYEYENRNKIR